MDLQSRNQERTDVDAGPPAQDARFREVVQASLEGWQVFVRAGLSSEFYRQARQHVHRDRAARVTLLYLYLSTFAGEERERLERDVEFFLSYAENFVKELFPREHRAPEFRRASRAVFRTAMRRMLRETTSPAARADARSVMRATLRACASSESIVDAWDHYKEYMYRYYPQWAHREI